MGRGDFSPGLWNASSYQVSGIPYVTSSLAVPANTSEPLVVEFDFITKSFVVRNDGAAAIRLGYSINGITEVGGAKNYIVLDSGISFEAEYRISKLYLMSDTAVASTASVSAGLTSISSSELMNNWSDTPFNTGI
jgi:hypothetical protein